ncbi:MAG TPA: alpha-L-arabinofuranosidase [Candidatus Ornithomonoglobus intestinigallinarum]|uniref:non-reducing end alpha-L-arabinofuranosidase n=1 Tax=Candidatus Ornithomonoglobus intestinigallinarum TaxID=2840894 RepID=A0A9D1H392_9FIRM|nr:alpha-L-arabinofuranosidase [Candidatus Ornithomonoglobus intestinigallinarum]
MKITVNANKETAKLGDLYGIFFEDINHAADGGLYGELLQNRSFEFCRIDNPSYDSLTAWQTVMPDGASGSVSVQTGHSHNPKNPHFLVIDAIDASSGIGVRNEGYNGGIPLAKDAAYDFSCRICCDGRPAVLEIALEDKNGNAYQSEEICFSHKEWRLYTIKFKSPAADNTARLSLKLKKPGRVYIDSCSLFPADTFCGRKNGMRKDIAQFIADLKPKFMRFPGGCLIHQGSLNKDDRDSMYRWKDTIGDIWERPSRRNYWGYNQTFGLGYYEYFLFCEDIGAKPLPVLPAGYDPHRKCAAPIDALGEWIDDALDLIEFANGGTDTKWGKLRAELGHPEPFGLEYIGIGNEEVGAAFFERYAYFHKAVKEKYPDIKIINSAGPAVSGTAYRMGWESAAENGSDLIDEHYYQSPEWFIANHHHYDNYKGGKTKVFLGEYASKSNTWYSALAEASYMIGLERNAESVALACYAPLLCNADYVNWAPDMIWYDNHRVYGSANYYVQQLFTVNQGDALLETKIETELKNEAVKSKLGNKIYFMPNLRDGSAVFRCTDIKITTENGVLTHPDFMLLSAEKQPVYIGDASGSFTINFKAERISGRLGMAVWFDCANEDNKRKIEYGGWENQCCSAEEDIDGRNTSFDQADFYVETGVLYDVEIRVRRGRIVNIINGVTVNDVSCPEAVIEPIYCSASKEYGSGDVLIKAVNLRNNGYAAEFKLDGLNIKSAEVFHMDGFAPDDTNTFDEPCRVSPKKDDAAVENNIIKYTVPPMSVNVFRIKTK